MLTARSARPGEICSDLTSPRRACRNSTCAALWTAIRLRIATAKGVGDLAVALAGNQSTEHGEYEDWQTDPQAQRE
jgi:hypothetical protein